MTVDRAAMGCRLDADRASRFSDEPFYDNLPPRRFVIADRGLWQDDPDSKPGYDRRSFDLDGYRDEEREMAAALREATI